MKKPARKRARVWSKATAKAKVKTKSNVNVNVEKINLNRSEVEKTMKGELLTSPFIF